MNKNTLVLITLLLFVPITVSGNISNSTNSTSDHTGNNDTKTINNSLMNFFSNPTIIAALLGSGSILGIIISQHITERYKIREQFYRPYIDWCIAFSGALHEFEEISRNIFYESKCGTERYNKDTDILTHFFEIHQTVNEGYKHLSIIKKRHWRIGERLDDFMDVVDKTWHELEDEYTDIFITNDTVQSFLNKCLTRRKKITKEIRGKISQKLEELFDYYDDGKIKNKKWKASWLEIKNINTSNRLAKTNDAEKTNQKYPCECKEKFDELFYVYFDPIYDLLHSRSPNIGYMHLPSTRGFFNPIRKFCNKDFQFRNSIQE